MGKVEVAEARLTEQNRKRERNWEAGRKEKIVHHTFCEGDKIKSKPTSSLLLHLLWVWEGMIRHQLSENCPTRRMSCDIRWHDTRVFNRTFSKHDLELIKHTGDHHHSLNLSGEGRREGGERERTNKNVVGRVGPVSTYRKTIKVQRCCR